MDGLEVLAIQSLKNAILAEISKCQKVFDTESQEVFFCGVPQGFGLNVVFWRDF